MESKLDDEKRLKEILDMTKSRLQMRFLSAGHTTAALRALSYASPMSKFKDDTDGIGVYEVIKRIDDNFESEKADLVSKLQTLSGLLFRADNMMVSYTATRDGFDNCLQGIKKVSSSLNSDKVIDEKQCMIHCEKKNEGFKTSSEVQYVARVGNFIDKGTEYHGALQILKVIMSYEYLWQNIRIQGGAYGCMSSFNRIGDGYFVSYRDPNLERTMKVYEDVVDYLKSFTVDERDMTKYIIGTISNMDRPMTPSAKGDRAMNLYMNHVSAEMIQKERNEVLDATQEDIRNLSKVVEAVLAAEQICVIGSEEKVEENKDMFMEVKTLN